MKNWKKRGNETSIKDVFLRNQGIADLDEANEWFRKAVGKNYRIDRLSEACEMIRSYKDKPILIVGDYDCDGITSTSILLIMFRMLGYTNVSFRIPKRFSEGFGINEKIVDEAKEGLIITCDNGIAQIDAVKKAKDKGLDVIIIDHHLPVVENGEEILPEADVIVDPNAIPGSADFSGYCGAGLCYKIAQAMLPDEVCKTLLPLACLGTIGDVMELTEENYVFVRNGLKYMLMSNICPRGLYSLLTSLSLVSNVTSTDLAFKVAPAVNAVSRLEDDGASKVIKLLTSNLDVFTLNRQAALMLKYNEQRKQLKAEGMEKAEELIRSAGVTVPLVLYIKDCHEGIVGIIAGALCEKYKVPAIVLTDTADGLLKGSGRSCGNYDMKARLDDVASLLSQYGGHTGAAGLSLPAANLVSLRKMLIKKAGDFITEDEETVYYDLEGDAKIIKPCIEQLAQYGPYGEGNPEIVFKINGFVTAPNKKGQYLCSFGGGDMNVTKIVSDKKVGAIGFNLDLPADVSKKLSEGSHKVEIVGTLSNNYFNDSVTPQIQIADIRCSDD